MHTSAIERLAPLTTTMRARAAAVVDVGGTTTRVAQVDLQRSECRNIRRVPTPNFLSHPDLAADELIATLCRRVAIEVSAALRGRCPDLLIMGYPGPMTANGIALRSPTILGGTHRQHIHVASQLREWWPQAEIRVLNDLCCSGYAFVSRGYRDFCVFTVGSGIGNKVFLNGAPYVGPGGFGGEIGHVKVSPGPGTPVSNVRVDLGDIASGRGTARLAQRWAQVDPFAFSGSPLVALLDSQSLDRWSEQLVAAFHARDVLAIQIVEAAAFPLAAAIAHLHLGIGITRIFVTGGFATALGEEYRRLLVRLVREHCWDVGQDWNSTIELSNADQEDGLAGAAYLAGVMDRDASAACDAATGGGPR